jgi:hypothetical protein
VKQGCAIVLSFSFCSVSSAAISLWVFELLRIYDSLNDNWYHFLFLFFKFLNNHVNLSEILLFSWYYGDPDLVNLKD